jgi:hypothetical protein
MSNLFHKTLIIFRFYDSWKETRKMKKCIYGGTIVFFKQSLKISNSLCNYIREVLDPRIIFFSNFPNRIDVFPTVGETMEEFGVIISNLKPNYPTLYTPFLFFV